MPIDCAFHACGGRPRMALSMCSRSPPPAWCPPTACLAKALRTVLTPCASKSEGLVRRHTPSMHSKSSLSLLSTRANAFRILPIACPPKCTSWEASDWATVARCLKTIPGTAGCLDSAFATVLRSLAPPAPRHRAAGMRSTFSLTARVRGSSLCPRRAKAFITMAALRLLRLCPCIDVTTSRASGRSSASSPRLSRARALHSVPTVAMLSTAPPSPPARWRCVVTSSTTLWHSGRITFCTVSPPHSRSCWYTRALSSTAWCRRFIL
mmetsp:Transcript_42146/g.102914  ORF Transcript_42146/g.102914 Transcript_42146/m.102914 type:complete len:266 (-) Transcript_42146:444-1241(-)